MMKQNQIVMTSLVDKSALGTMIALRAPTVATVKKIDKFQHLLTKCWVCRLSQDEFVVFLANKVTRCAHRLE